LRTWLVGEWGRLQQQRVGPPSALVELKLKVAAMALNEDLLIAEQLSPLLHPYRRVQGSSPSPPPRASVQVAVDASGTSVQLNPAPRAHGDRRLTPGDRGYRSEELRHACEVALLSRGLSERVCMGRGGALNAGGEGWVGAEAALAALIHAGRALFVKRALEVWRLQRERVDRTTEYARGVLDVVRLFEGSR
jgi:hypothetical protein